MLLEYGAKNYFCFKEWVSISFKLNNNCPIEISQGEDFSTILGVKGANGSGKTNALKALSFMSEFCSDSWGTKPDDPIAFDTYFNNPDPTEFYAEFRLGAVSYRYELKLTKQQVLREALYRTERRETLIIERIGNKLRKCIEEFSELKIIKLRDNASLISTANQYDIKKTAEIYSFFSRMLANVYFLGMHDQAPDLANISEFYSKHQDYFDFVKELIIAFDPGIKDIVLHELTKEDGSIKYTPFFSYDIDQEKKFLTFYTQSSGTKSLYLQLGRYKYALDSGAVMILDEFDINLHPLILPRLLDFFTDHSKNQNRAQLIFTTHNTEVLEYLGRYRTYLVNKDNNESYAYRLDEIPGDILRNDRPISPLYISGKIGGVPKF